MENQIDETMIREMFPELAWIEDGLLRKKCVEALRDAFAEGKWNRETMGRLPVSVTKVHCQELNNGIMHMRVVVQIAASIYDLLESMYGRNLGQRDVVIAGAMLHDLGKPMEFCLLENQEAGYAADAKMIRHPLSGAILADRHGLDRQIVHIIATHSFEGKESYKTLAAQIVCAADNIAFAYLLAFNPET